MICRVAWSVKLRMSAIFIFSISLPKRRLTSIGVCIPFYQKKTFIEKKIIVANFDLIILIEQFGIQGPESYLYTSKSGCLDVDGIDDVKDSSETLVSCRALINRSHLGHSSHFKLRS